MERLDIDEVKKIQLEILDTVSDFCDKNDIKYWIDCGTLLGAIRHNGYIPWDDDIDIGMLREDYDKFRASFNKSNKQYKMICGEDKNLFAAYGKVIDTSTVLYEPDESGFKLSVNIDVFVYDNAPDDDNMLQKQYKTRDFYKRLFDIQHSKGVPLGFVFRKIIAYCGRKCLKIFPENFFVDKVVKNAQKYMYKETERVGNFTASAKMSCNKKVFQEFVLVDFEGKKYKAPVGFDEWLKAFYGDYMQLPPVEKRVSHHSFVAYKK